MKQMLMMVSKLSKIWNKQTYFLIKGGLFCILNNAGFKKLHLSLRKKDLL